VCVNVCTYVCMCVCTYVCIYVCTYVCMYICMYVRMYVCMYVRMYVCVYVYMYVRIYVLCMYVWMYVCFIPPGAQTLISWLDTSSPRNCLLQPYQHGNECRRQKKRQRWLRINCLQNIRPQETGTARRLNDTKRRVPQFVLLSQHYELTPRGLGAAEGNKFPGSQEFPTFYVTRKFIAVCTKIHHESRGTRWSRRRFAF